MDNILLLCDSYKVSHYKQYPPGTTHVYSYFESRGGRFPYTVFFGLQYIIKRYLQGVVVTKEKVEEAKELVAAHFCNDSLFNEEGWNYIIERHGGRLPVRICAVAEGSVVPVHNVLFTVENTDPHTPWLTSILETLLVQVWYPMTVATNSRIQKQIIQRYLTDTHDSIESLPMKLNDFGFRGCSSVESAGLGGAAHLVNFKGTDSLMAVQVMRKYYHEPMAGFSVVASEHSTMTSWGRTGELEAYRNMLRQFPDGVIGVVSDSYNIWDSIEKMWGQELKAEVVARGNNGGVLVLRPDSGHPPTVVLKCLMLLEKSFGTTLNSKGYKMLPKFVRLIQGDGISYSSLSAILDIMKENRWSAENVLYGSGGALIQKVDRDTQKCAYKCSTVTVDGADREVFKDPITDPGKKSKRGRLQLHRTGDTWVTLQQGEGDKEQDQLKPVFEDGELLSDQTLRDIRARAAVTDEELVSIMAFLEQDQLRRTAGQ